MIVDFFIVSGVLGWAHVHRGQMNHRKHCSDEQQHLGDASSSSHKASSCRPEHKPPFSEEAVATSTWCHATYRDDIAHYWDGPLQRR
jgi:hypothetical protein